MEIILYKIQWKLFYMNIMEIILHKIIQWKLFYMNTMEIILYEYNGNYFI